MFLKTTVTTLQQSFYRHDNGRAKQLSGGCASFPFVPLVLLHGKASPFSAGLNSSPNSERVMASADAHNYTLNSLASKPIAILPAPQQIAISRFAWSHAT